MWLGTIEKLQGIWDSEQGTGSKRGMSQPRCQQGFFCKPHASRRQVAETMAVEEVHGAVNKGVEMVEHTGKHPSSSQRAPR